MEIKQLRAFLAVAETKTFTAGAKRTCVTQAAISMQIRQLEEEIGIPLFTRTPRQVVLTEAGEKLIVRARKILREHETALAELAELVGAEYGRLRIGSASAMFATVQLPTILEQLKRFYANAEVTVTSGTSQTLVEKILHGEIDLAFVSLPVENASVHSDLLFSDRIVVIFHPEHELAREKSISAKNLAEHPLILGEKGGNTRRLIDEFFAAANVKPHIVMELSRQEAINQMVENRMGIGLAGAKAITEEVAAKKLVAVKLADGEIHWDLGLAHLNNGYLSPIAKEFISLCRKSFVEREKKLRAGK